MSAVPTTLVAFNWSTTSNRYDRVARFVEHLFSRLDKLPGPGFDPQWKSINLAATVPGLMRFPAAQAWLDNHARGSQASQLEVRPPLSWVHPRAGAEIRWR